MSKWGRAEGWRGVEWSGRGEGQRRGGEGRGGGGEERGGGGGEGEGRSRQFESWLEKGKFIRAPRRLCELL